MRCPERDSDGERRYGVTLSQFVSVSRLAGAQHPAIYCVRHLCAACGGAHDALLTHEELDHAPVVGPPTGEQFWEPLTGRIAGDTGEELVLLVRGGESSATAAAARVVSGLRELRFADGLRVTCSAGVAALAEGGDSASLFASADEALYEAKRRGKDRVVLARRPEVAARRRAAGVA